VSETLVYRIECIQAVLRAYPYQFIIILPQAVDMIAADAFGVGGIFSESLEGISVKTVQPVARTEPHKPFFILQNAEYIIIGKAILNFVVPEVVTFLRAGTFG
jgi:hypothetical protein